MKQRKKMSGYSLVVAAAAAMLVLLSVEVALAQQPAAAPPRAAVRIRNMPRVGRPSLTRTPDYQNNVRRTGSGARRREWALFEVNYETAPEWIDELTFTFHVMTQDAQKQYHYFETTVTYIDVARGEHIACVVLPPAAVARYGESNAFGVEIMAAGERIAFKGVGPADEWWRMIDGNPNIHKRPGYLVDRSKTPFAMAYIDDYEVVR